jgi:3-oxoacyl-[acyl-carrier protein] reductase
MSAHTGKTPPPSGRGQGEGVLATALLAGKRCLVTGGSRGLGLAICEEFAKQGARVAFTYSKNDDDAEEALARIGEASLDPLPRNGGPSSSSPVLRFKGSVADSAHVNATIAALLAAWGGIDVLVNNAGITQILPIALVEEKDWDEVIAVNLKGAYLFTRACLKPMIKAKQGGAILSIGSFASERFVESPVHYAASKSALRGFSEALSLEVGRYGITVNLLSPGLLDVGLGTMLPQHRLREYLGQSALGRLGTAAEMARLAAFLVSDKNRFMTGAKVVADGGL